MRTLPGVLGVALGVSLLLPAPAFAHNSLTGSDPRDGARVATAPARIELRFLAKPDPGTTKITLTGPDNVVALGGAPTFSGNRVSVPFKPGRAGLYVVGYQVPSGDGHRVTGEVRFTLITGTPAEPSTSASPADPAASVSAVPPSAGSPPTASTPAVAVEPASRESDDPGGPGWIWALGGLVLLTALLLGFLLRHRSAGG